MNQHVKQWMRLCLMLTLVAVANPGNAQMPNSSPAKAMNSEESNADVIMKIFRAVEKHDQRTMVALCRPDVEFLWPPSPFGSQSGVGRAGGLTWTETWALLQPTAAERKMDPRIVATNDDDVVVLWRQRGLSPAGERFDGAVLGLYHFRDRKLARAQMFYFDTAAVNRFLMKAITPELRQRSKAVFAQITEMPVVRQVLIRQEYWKLQAMTSKQRQAELDAGGPQGKFSDQERDLLEQLLALSTPPEK